MCINFHDSKKYILLALIVLMLEACAPIKPIPGSPYDFMLVTATSQDSLPSLASKYLKDSRKAWQIAKFNGITRVTPGQELIIPLKPVRPGGLTATGYQTIPILSYHHFSKIKRDKLFVRADDFEQQMQFLKNNGYHVITLDQLFDFLEFSEVPEKSVVITIDDGWSDAYHIAFPILKQYGFPATLFIQTDLINQNPKTLSWNQIREMTNNRDIEVQCHTKTHRDLTKQKTGESFKRYFDAIERELDEARRIIKEKLNLEVKYLSYPYGKTNQLVVDLVQKKGYRAAFTVNRDSNPFFINNYRLNRAMIYGHYGASNLKEFKKALTTFKAKRIAAVEEPIDRAKSFRLISPKQAEQYEKQRQWRTALLHWKMIRDSLIVKNGDSTIIVKAKKRITAIKNQLRRQADNDFKNGKDYYAKGNLEKAQKQWLHALLLNPEHKYVPHFLKTKLGGDKHKLVAVKVNDTLKKIAKRMYGDSNKYFLVTYFYKNINVNNDLKHGMMLNLPVIDRLKLVSPKKPKKKQPQKKQPQKKQSKKKQPQKKTVCGLKLTKSKRQLANDYYAKGHNYFNSNKISQAKSAFKTAKCLGHPKAAQMLSVLP